MFPVTCIPKLRLFELNGHRLTAKATIIAREDMRRGEESGNAHFPPQRLTRILISIELPSDCKGFFAIVKGAGAIRVDGQLIGQATHHRDLMMVNPGNDGLYHEWVERDRASRGASVAARKNMGETMGNEPLFSVITPLFETPIPFLAELIESMKAQSLMSWEHILVNASPKNAELNSFLRSIDDDRFKVIALEGNRGISENTIAGIGEAEGEYIAFVDHDDVLDPHALEEFANAIKNDPDVDMLYCDEDSISNDGRERFAPIFKPDFNLSLFTSWNYLHHMIAVKREMLSTVVLPGSDMDGSQDYDLTLKVAAKTSNIIHIPRVLYHWRQHEDSVNGGSVSAKPYVIETSVAALDRFFCEIGISASTEAAALDWLYKVNYKKSEKKDVLLVVEGYDEDSLNELLRSLETQRHSILKEIVVVGEEEFSLEDVSSSIRSLVRFSPPKREQALDSLEEIVAGSAADYIVLVDGRVSFLPESDAIGILRDMFARKDMGIASAKAMSADDLNVHVGLCVKEDGSIGYLNQGFIHGMGGGYNGCAECGCDYSAVDSACIAFRKEDFVKVGGFSEDYESNLARDVDFSFRIRELGKVVMVNPDARVRIVPDPELLDLGASHLKGTEDLEKLWRTWGGEYRHDVLANPNYSMEKSFFNLNI